MQDILTEMGINKVGDTIAIMKHAKEVHEKVESYSLSHDYHVTL